MRAGRSKGHLFSIVIALMGKLVCVNSAASFLPFTDPQTENSPSIATPEAVKVDGRSGSAAYTYNIAVPSGTGGLTPPVTFTFSTLNKNSEYGWG